MKHALLMADTKRVLLLATLLVLPACAFAQAKKGDVVPPPPPVPAPPVPAPAPSCSDVLAKHFDGGLDPRIEPDCDATSFYFGIGRDKDPVLARACAFIERYKNVDKDGSMFTGPGILSMVYANGDGTPRDLELARRFTCENKEASPGEIQARLEIIEKIAVTPVNPPKFDLCATAKTATSWSWCTSVLVRQHDSKRYNEMVAIVDKLTPEGQEAFKKLQTAEGVYEAARAEGEIDQNGLANQAWILQEQDKIRATFVADLKLFNDPNFKQPVAYSIADTKVAEDYQKVRVNAPKLFANTTITLAGVDKAQAAWFKYREAWRAYEGVVNPNLTGDDVACQISRERIYQLHKLLTP